jgi:hypothetical protein
MEDTYTVYHAFISSPGDVSEERKLAEEAIDRINKTIRDTLATIIDARKWEHLPPVAPHFAEEKLQDIINKEVEKCHFFILILYKRYGTVQQGYSISNTEREIETILHAHEKNPKLRILTYFRELEPNSDPGEQEIKVRELRSKLENMGIPYKNYHNPNEFNLLLTHDLYDVVLRIQNASFKKQALHKFWRFGEVDRPNVSRIAILYPPVERNILSEGNKPDYWIKKLANQIAFEDHKAILKIENNLSLLGFYKNYKVYPYTNQPHDVPWINRIWLCLPRNRLGLKELQKHTNLRFQLPLTGNRPNIICWKNKKGKCINISSPMEIYLQRQRSKMDISREWHGQLTQLVAKDFAVVARVKREQIDTEEPLWDYFFAGIRGLGTWGATWFIDKEYKQLKRFDDVENIELLLEVTYQDGRIFSVTDVSEKPESYFTLANDPKTIDKVIQEYEY